MAAAQRKMETFNSMKYFELLKQSGVSEAQARVQVEMVQEASRSGLEHLATKEDLMLVKMELKEEIATVRTELKEEIAGIKTSIANLASTINTSKWQALAGIVLLMVGGFFTKHLGF